MFLQGGVSFDSAQAGRASWSAPWTRLGRNAGLLAVFTHNSRRWRCTGPCRPLCCHAVATGVLRMRRSDSFRAGCAYSPLGWLGPMAQGLRSVCLSGLVSEWRKQPIWVSGCALGYAPSRSTFRGSVLHCIWLLARKPVGGARVRAPIDSGCVFISGAAAFALRRRA